MIIQFPDGFSVDTAKGMTPFMDRPTAQLSFVDGAGGVGATKYSYYDLLEGVGMLQQILDGLKNQVVSLVLVGNAPLPTNGNTVATDMYPSNSATTPTIVVSGQRMIVVIGRSASSEWPPLQAGGPMVASFRPDVRVRVGGQNVTNLSYVNGVTLIFNLPALPAGVTYDMVYSDSRGSVTKSACFSY